MTSTSILIKEKIVRLSDLQKNPFQALNADIVRIVKNGKEIGIFMSKEEFEDFMEENLELREEFQKELKKTVKKSKRVKLVSLGKIL